MDFFLKFVMPSNPRFLCVVRATIGELGSVYGWPEEECRRVILALDEALANVIRHAYKNAHDQEIEVNCRAAADYMEFKLLDHGEPADPARICGQPLNDAALSGRGTHMMKMIMDEMLYERVPGGNQLTLTKRLPATQLGATSG